MKLIIKSSLVALTVMAANISFANSISPDFLTNEVDMAYNEYLNGSPEVATYAMESIIRLQESDQSSELLQKTGPASLSFSYIRLGFLYEESGAIDKAEEAFSKAVSRYKSLYKQNQKVSVNELKTYVKQLDALAAGHESI